MGRLKIRSGLVEFIISSYELHWQVVIKVGFAVKE